MRRASVSAFGFGGSNTHVVLDDAFNFLRSRGLEGCHWTSPEPSLPRALEYHDSLRTASLAIAKQRRYGEVKSLKTPKLLVWSAADQGTLGRLTTSFSSMFKNTMPLLDPEGSELFLQNIAYTLSDCRSHLSWRSFATLTSTSDVSDLEGKYSQPLRSMTLPKIAYVFTGQGAQYAGMAKELMHNPSFLASLKKSEIYFAQLGSSWSLKSECFGGPAGDKLTPAAELLKPKTESMIDQAELSQPLCTAIQIALVDLLQNLNLEPSVVLGHSSGEIAAA